MADLEVDSNLSGGVRTTVDGSFGRVGPVSLEGIPDELTLRIAELAKIEVGLDPVESTVTLNPVRLDLGPIETSLSIKEIPSVRAHLPLNYTIGLSLFGVELAALRVCGEGMIITEPYRPTPCEICGPVATGQVLDSTTEHRDDGVPGGSR